MLALPSHMAMTPSARTGPGSEPQPRGRHRVGTASIGSVFASPVPGAGLTHPFGTLSHSSAVVKTVVLPSPMWLLIRIK